MIHGWLNLGCGSLEHKGLAVIITPLDYRKSKRVSEKPADGDYSYENKRRNKYFCFIDYAKAFDCVDHHKLWNVFQETGIPDHLTWLLRSLYACQEEIVRTGH